MATTPSKSLVIKGRLLFVPEGKTTEDAIEVGEVEIPMTLDFRPAGNLGHRMRSAAGLPVVGDHGSQRDGIGTRLFADPHGV